MVAASPAEIAWYIAPGKIVIAPSQPVKTDITPQFNEHALLTPIEISQDSLRRSLKDGTAIPNANSWDWDIHETHPLCQLFFGKISKFQRRLLDCAVQIQEAGCATSYATQLQMAVASMEVLLKPKSFSDLERILRAFFHGSDQEKRIESLLKTRHRITHEGAGRGDDAGQVKDGARDALNFAWLMLDIVTAFDRGVNALSFDDYILLLIQAIDLDEKSASLKRENPRAHEQMLHKDVSSFVQYLTARIKFSTVNGRGHR